MVIRKNIAHSFLNLARFSNNIEMIFFMFWKEMAIAKLTTSAIGQNKHSYHEKIEKVVFVKILKSIADAIRFAILEFTRINLNDINKSIKKLARLIFDF